MLYRFHPYPYVSLISHHGGRVVLTCGDPFPYGAKGDTEFCLFSGPPGLFLRFLCHALQAFQRRYFRVLLFRARPTSGLFRHGLVRTFRYSFGGLLQGAFRVVSEDCHTVRDGALAGERIRVLRCREHNPCSREPNCRTGLLVALRRHRVGVRQAVVVAGRRVTVFKTVVRREAFVRSPANGGGYRSKGVLLLCGVVFRVGSVELFVSSSMVSTIGRGQVHSIPSNAIKKHANGTWGPLHYGGSTFGAMSPLSPVIVNEV